jgi:hypothetical protein
MRLITAHRILIGISIAFFTFLGLSTITRATGAVSYAAGGFCLVIAVGMVFYMRSLRGK